MKLRILLLTLFSISTLKADEEDEETTQTESSTTETQKQETYTIPIIGTVSMDDHRNYTYLVPKGKLESFKIRWHSPKAGSAMIKLGDKTIRAFSPVNRKKDFEEIIPVESLLSKDELVTISTGSRRIGVFELTANYNPNLEANSNVREHQVLDEKAIAPNQVLNLTAPAGNVRMVKIYWFSPRGGSGEIKLNGKVIRQNALIRGSKTNLEIMNVNEDFSEELNLTIKTGLKSVGVKSLVVVYQ